MKYVRMLLLLSAPILLASTALAQTGDLQAANKPSSASTTAVTTARCQYTPADEVCAGLGAATHAKRSDNDTTVAQRPRRMPGPPPRRPTMGRPRAAYPGMWSSPGSGRHALIGALIGGGIGAALGLRGNADVRASLALGTLGAGIGAAMGFSIPSLPSRNPYRRRWPGRGWPDEDELASQTKPDSAKPDASQQAALRPGPPQAPARVEDPRAPSADVP